MAHDHNPDEKIVYVGDSRVRKKSERPAPRDYSAYPGKSEAFIPNFLLKEWMVGAVVLVGFLALTIAHPSPLGKPADPMTPGFIPMPDWYFLFLYQLLKYPYTSDLYVVLGTVGIPGLAFGALLLAPFLDTGKERRFYRRPVASSLMFLSLFSIIYLTYVSWDHYTEELERKNIIPEHILMAEERKANKGKPKEEPKDPSTLSIVGQDEEGFTIYQKATCIQCHGDQLQGMGTAIPTLKGIGDKYDAAQIMDIVENGKGGMQPQYDDNIKTKGLTDEQLVTLTEWLAKQKSE